ncbi:MAG: EamA family transporter, partial [Nitriliruptoraceae bacterium]
PGRRWLLATAATVAGAGVLLLAGGGDAGQDPGPAGVLVGLLAGAAYGTYTTVSVALVRAGADGTSAVALTFTGAGVLLLPVLATGDLAWTTGVPGVGTVLWLTLGTTALGYALFARGLASLDAPTVTTLTLAEPLAATLLAVALVGERLSLAGWTGAALLVVGLVALAPTGRGGRSRPGATGAGR